VARTYQSLVVELGWQEHIILPNLAF